MNQDVWSDDEFKRLRVELLKLEVKEKTQKLVMMEAEEQRKAVEFEANLRLIRAQAEESVVKRNLMKAQHTLIELQIKSAQGHESLD